MWPTLATTIGGPLRPLPIAYKPKDSHTSKGPHMSTLVLQA